MEGSLQVAVSGPLACTEITFVCPACHEGVLTQGHEPRPTYDCFSCGQSYPVVNGCPVLVNEAGSLFSLADFTERAGKTTMDLQPLSERSFKERLKGRLHSWAPSKSCSVCDYEPQDFIAERVAENPDARILVVGAGDMDFEAFGDENIVYSDVALGPLTTVVSDAHDLPFEDGYFDAVIVVAVLEHVLDPARVASEIARVIKPAGCVYANTPFMQQVHMGRYDFTRFTHLGHRRLWRDFDEIRAGVANGSGVALSWAAEYWVRTVFGKSKIETLACFAIRFLMTPFRWSDKFLKHKPGVYDAASAYFFAGRKRDCPLSDHEILAAYKGKQ